MRVASHLYNGGLGDGISHRIEPIPLAGRIKIVQLFALGLKRYLPYRKSGPAPSQRTSFWANEQTAVRQVIRFTGDGS